MRHVWGLMTNPRAEWARIRDRRCSVASCYLGHILLLAAIAPVAGFVGTTQVGWKIGAREHFLTTDSAALIAVAVYAAMLIGVFTVGWMVHWMSETYQAEKSFSQSVALAGYTATPLFLIGIMLLYPVLWLNMILGMLAVSYTVYLLYVGVPIMMEVEKERGFLFSSSLLGFGLVALVALLAATVILWANGFAPQIVSALEPHFLTV